MERFHIVPYPLLNTRHPSHSPLYAIKFHKFFAPGGDRRPQELYWFQGYWMAIKMFGGEEGLIRELRKTGSNFQSWCRDTPETLEIFRNKARERGYEDPDTSTLNTTVFADIEEPITVSKKEAKEYFAKYPQPRWILNRKSHPSHQQNETWPRVDGVWPSCLAAGNNQGVATQSPSTEPAADDDEDDDISQVEPSGSAPPSFLPNLTEDDNSVLRSLRNILRLRQMARDGYITWQQFVEQTEDIAASVSAVENGIIEETAPDEYGDDDDSSIGSNPWFNGPVEPEVSESSSTVSSNPYFQGPDEPEISEPPARLDTSTDINPRKRLLEDADPADGARPLPGPARWAAEFHEEAALDMSRTLSAPARRLAVTKTTHQGETWYVLAWGTQAAGMSAGVAQAVQWIFTNHIKGSAKWSGLSLRFILKFSRMGQYAVMGKVADAPLSQETVNKLASGAHAGSLQTPIAAQAKMAAALVSRLMGCGEGTVLQKMMRLSVADLIAEGAAIDDPIVAAILGGDPEEYLGRRSDQVHRAVSPGFIELE